jgi:hypothetical protein
MNTRIAATIDGGGRRRLSRGGPRRGRACNPRWSVARDDQSLTGMKRRRRGNVVGLHDGGRRYPVAPCDRFDAVAGHHRNCRTAVPGPISRRLARRRSGALAGTGMCGHNLTAGRPSRGRARAGMGLLSLRGLRLRDRSGRVGMADGSEGIFVKTRRIRTAGGNAGGYQRQHGCSRKKPRTQHFDNAPHRTLPTRDTGAELIPCGLIRL